MSGAPPDGAPGGPDPDHAARLRGRTIDSLQRIAGQYRALLESLDQGFCVIEVLFDAQGRAEDFRFVETNPAFARQTGLHDAVGCRMRELVPGHEMHWFEAYGQVARTGVPLCFVEQARAPGGRWFEIQAFRVGAPGEHRVAVLLADISDRVQAERALRASEERFHCLANATPAILWSAGADGDTHWLSARWREYTGLPADVDAARRQRAIHPDDLPAVQAAWARAHAARAPMEVALRLRRHDGAWRWFLARAAPVLDAAGEVQAWHGSSTDIHDQREAQDQLRALDRRKDAFLATLAHELRNPLAPLRNSLDVLLAAGEGQVDVRRLHLLMQRQVGQLARLVDDLMEVSRISRGGIALQLQPLALAEVLEQAVEACRPQLDAGGHQLQLEPAPVPVLLQADPVRLPQVLANLLGNAIKYTPAGGTIVLAARTGPGEVVLTVRDTGLGIAPDELRAIFEPFTQAAHSLRFAQGGLGIGLALVRNLVELHGGQVLARSAGLGRGSEFEVRLPWDGATVAPATGSAAPERAPAHARKLRLLLVDDDPEQTDILALYLRMLGHRVRTANDAATALVWQRAFRPDAVLLDLGMPDVDGYEVARRLRGEPGGAALALVALSGWGQEEVRQRAQAAGFDAHLAKPADPARLLDLLQALVATRGAATRD